MTGGPGRYAVCFTPEPGPPLPGSAPNRLGLGRRDRHGLMVIDARATNE